MAADLYGLTAAQVLRLRRMLQWAESQDGYPPIGEQPPSGHIVGRVFGRLDNAIAGTTGLLSKAKSGTLSIYRIASTTGGTSDTGRNITVWNMAPSACSTDRWTFAGQEAMNGRFLVDFQGCS